MSTPRRTVGFNFLSEPELPGPQVTEAQAEQIVAQHYGMTARATLLGSNQDCNFIMSDANDDTVGVLKIANPAFNATELDAQDAAADLIADTEPSLRIAVPLPNVAGDTCTAITGLLDKTAYVRLLRFLPGGTLYESGYLPPTAVAGLGEVAGRVSRALAGFAHPGLDRALQWDLRYGADVVAQLTFPRCRPIATGTRRGGRGGRVVPNMATRRQPAAAGDAPRSDGRQRRRHARRGQGRAP